MHADPDLDALPDGVRRIAELCLAKNPADRPTPGELLAEIGDIPPSATPWPREVHRLIDRQHAEVVALLDGDPAEPTVIRPPTVETTTMALPGATEPAPAPDTVAVETRAVAQAKRRRWLVPAVAAVVVVAAVAGLVVWSPWSGERRQDGLTLLTEDAGLVTQLRFSPDGTTLGSVDYGGLVELWNVADGRKAGATLVEDGETMAFSHDGELVAAGVSLDPTSWTVRWWDVDTRQELGRIEFADDVTDIVFSRDGRLVTESSGVVQWWDLATKQEAGRLHPGTDAIVKWLAVSPDGTRLATSDTDDVVRLWDMATGLPVGEPLRNDCEEWATRVAFSPDGTVLAASDGVELRLWDVASRAAITPPDIKEPNGLAFSPDSNTIAVSESYERLWLYHLPD